MEIFTPDLFFALGFFLFVMHLIRLDHNRDYNRELNEKREFGYRKVVPKKRTLFRSRKK
jgi:hypothetical protein